MQPKDLEAPVLTGIILIGSALTYMVGLVTNVLAHTCALSVSGMTKLSKRIQNKEGGVPCDNRTISYEVATYAIGIAEAVLFGDDSSPPIEKQNAEQHPDEGQSSGSLQEQGVVSEPSVSSVEEPDKDASESMATPTPT